MADNEVAWWTKGRLQRGANMGGDAAVLKKYLPNIAQNLNFIKMNLSSLVKMQESDKKTQYFEKQRRRSEDYAARYKKVKPTREDKKVVSAEKKSFFDIIKDGLSSIFKFALLGLVAIGASKLLSLPGVMDGLKMFFKKLILGISELIQKGVSFLTDLLKDNEVVSSITKLIKSVFVFIADGISSAADFIKNIVTDPSNKESIGKVIVAVIGTVFSAMLSSIDIVGKTLGQNQEAIKNGIVTIFTKIAEGIVGAIKFTDSLLKDPKFIESVVKIYDALKEFIGNILNTTIGTIPGIGPVNLKMALITLGGVVVLTQLALSYFMGRLIAGSVARGMESGGVDRVGGKYGKAAAVVNLGLGAAAGYFAYQSVEQFEEAQKAAEKDMMERVAAEGMKMPADQVSPTKIPSVPSTVQSSSAMYYDPSKGGNAIRDVIGAGEGGRTGYNATYGFGYGKQDPRIEEMFGTGRKLTDLSINEVLYYTTKRGANQGAVGKYQFMPDTLRGLVSKASGYGINFETKFTPEIQDKLYGLFSQKNVEVLKKNNIPITPENIHLAHSVGAGGAIKLLTHKDQNANILEVLGLKGAEAKTNPHLNTSIANYRATLAGKYGGQGGTTLASTKPSLNNAMTNVMPPEGQNYSMQNVNANVPSPAPSNTKPPPEPPPTLGETLANLISTGPSGNFLKQLDEMTGGKLGISSGDLAKALRTRNLFENVGDVIEGSTNLASSSSIEFSGPIPGVFDETLLSKLSMA
jgi:hypothetical protein